MVQLWGGKSWFMINHGKPILKKNAKQGSGLYGYNQYVD